MQSNGKTYKNKSTSGLKAKKLSMARDMLSMRMVRCSMAGLTLMAIWLTAMMNWANATYYFGSWEDGSMKTGWQKITVYDDEDGKRDGLQLLVQLQVQWSETCSRLR